MVTNHVKRMLLIIILLTTIITSISFGKAENSYSADADIVDNWIHDWQASQFRGSSGPFVLHRFKDRVYAVKSALKWKSDDPARAELEVNVPVGFVTDFASVPRVFWSIFPPDGDYGFPAIFHDYLYWQQPFDRLVADRIFLSMMKEFEVNPVSRWAIYKGVRLGGWLAWKNNAEMKASGERRLIVKFPDNPTLTWAEWKLNSQIYSPVNEL